MVGVVTPTLAPVRCCRQFPQSCVQFSCCVRVVHTLDQLHRHGLMIARLVWLKLRKNIPHVCMVAELSLSRTRSLRCHVCRASDPRTAGTLAASSEDHHAIHQGLIALRRVVDTRSRVRLVGPKTLDRFRKKNAPSWRTWSCLARDFVGVVHVALK